MVKRLGRWLDRNILEVGREMRLSYLPPLMVYLAAGISGLTAIVGTFFVKDYLGLSAEFLAGLGFWAGIPWALKMPLGHIVDLIWRFKSGLVWLGASLIAASLCIMLGLLAYPASMSRIMSLEAWYILSVLLAPVGYVIQDVVADAMTVEAVPRLDSEGRPFPEDRLRLMHTTMQTLGRVAIVGGGTHRLRRLGFSWKQAWATVQVQEERPAVNWWILGGSLVFVVFTLTIGLGNFPFNQEIIFFGSLGIVLFLISRLVQALEPRARGVLVGTAIIIFVYRAIPTPGPGSTWWMIDKLHFDQQFLSVLSLISSSLALGGMFVFRRFMAERSIAYVVGFLTIVTTLLSLPIIGLFYGLHHWTAAHTGGIVNAHFIALVDTALESPLGQVAMIPMLAWIANSAPANLKATFFAVMASFTNLALSMSQLGTKYLNQIFIVTREVKAHNTGAILVSANYRELGVLLITVSIIGLVLPFVAILLVKSLGWRSA
ncbi:MAG: hypothetical protein P8X58_13010 [Syntrophobacterales bacterium]